MDAADGGTDEEIGVVREIIEILTGGRIELVQMGERRSHGGWLQGQVQVRLLSVLVQKAGGRPPAADYESVALPINYRWPVQFAEQAEVAWTLYNKYWLEVDIAEELDCSKPNVTKLLKYAAQQHGKTLPDGRTRRGTLEKKHRVAPLYVRIADQVGELADKGKLIGEIAAEVSCDRNTATKALAIPTPRTAIRHQTAARAARGSHTRGSPAEAPQCVVNRTGLHSGLEKSATSTDRAGLVPALFLSTGRNRLADLLPIVVDHGRASSPCSYSHARAGAARGLWVRGVRTAGADVHAQSLLEVKRCVATRPRPPSPGRAPPCRVPGARSRGGTKAVSHADRTATGPPLVARSRRYPWAATRRFRGILIRKCVAPYWREGHRRLPRVSRPAIAMPR